LAIEGCALPGSRRVQDEEADTNNSADSSQSDPAQPGHAPAAGCWRLRRLGMSWWATWLV
jgi:hypothetical protein